LGREIGERRDGEIYGWAIHGGGAAGASAEGGMFLGSYATVMDAEMVGIAGAWEEGYTTEATDSQAAIKRCINITTGIQRAESWID